MMDTIKNIITNKDYIYLDDLFNKNYNNNEELKKISNNISTKKVKELINRVINLHEDHMYLIVSSLKKENYFGDEDE